MTKIIYYIFFIFTVFSSNASLLADDNLNPAKDSEIIFLLPETGKYNLLSKEIKETVQIYLTNFSQNGYKIIFINENNPKFLELILAELKNKADIKAFIGPVFSQNTRKLVEVLKNQDLDIKILSLSNDYKLAHYPNLKLLGFNIIDKIMTLSEDIASREEEYDNIYLVYNKHGLDKEFAAYFKEEIFDKNNKLPILLSYKNVRDFSRLLKAIAHKNKDATLKSAIVFVNLNNEIISKLNDFYKKYNLNPEHYEFYFLTNILNKAHFDQVYIENIHIIDYEHDSKFSNIYKKQTGRKPSNIAYATFDALEEIINKQE